MTIKRKIKSPNVRPMSYGIGPVQNPFDQYPGNEIPPPGGPPTAKRLQEYFKFQ